MSVEFWITTAAIVIGPLAAVLITHVLNARSETRKQQLYVFRLLMTTRRTPLSPERVQALNLVEVEFPKKKQVMAKFSDLLKTYNDQVRWKSDDESIRKEIVQEVDDKTAKLLTEMGKVLGYKLENLELLRSGYYPEAFSVLEKQQFELREFLAGLNSGSKVLPTAVLDVRHPDQILNQARATQEIIEFAVKKEEATK